MSIKPIMERQDFLQAVVTDVMTNDSYRVSSLGGVIWNARPFQPIGRMLALNETVKVIGRDGLTLLVQPLSQSEQEIKALQDETRSKFSDINSTVHELD